MSGFFAIMYARWRYFKCRMRFVMKQWETLDAVERNPDKVSRAWVFRGKRVPVSALFENIKDGATIEEFLEWFPGIKRVEVESVLGYPVGECYDDT